MAPVKRTGRSKKALPPIKDGSPPAPFKRPPEVLDPFIQNLSRKHVYITHIDSKPADFKRKIFLVPVAMNVGVLVLCILRLYYILPWYWKILEAGFGHVNEMTFDWGAATWADLAWEVGRRGFTMFIDFVLTVFLWPWPFEFVASMKHGNPALWRWHVGFRDKEIYVRRSRTSWDVTLTDVINDRDSRKILVGHIQAATAPMLQEQKTGYLLMNGQWNLDWDAMVHAHALVDLKHAAIEAFRSVVLVYQEEFGWLCYDVKTGNSALEDEKRRQVFAFRDALTGLGKEDLFYRWVEVVQYEATTPGGFGPERQAAAAAKIREMFEKENVDFDQLWKDTVGDDSTAFL
jgi:hypothetical protein